VSSCNVDISQAIAKLNKLPDNIKQKVTKYAMSDIVSKVASDVRTAIADSYNITKQNEKIKTKTFTDSGSIYASAAERNLMAFKGTVQNATGILAQVKKGSPLEIAHGFLAKMPSGQVLAMIRDGKGAYPIRSVDSLSIGNILKSKWIGDVVAKSLAENSQIIFAKKIESFADSWEKS
jgi:hypothetical protein